MSALTDYLETRPEAVNILATVRRNRPHVIVREIVNELAIADGVLIDEWKCRQIIDELRTKAKLDIRCSPSRGVVVWDATQDERNTIKRAFGKVRSALA